jgi:hypothetical protein
MRTSLIVICVLIGTINSLGQTVLLLDVSSNKPISYAHAVLNNKGQQIGGFYSDKNGQIYLHNLTENDSLIISCLGFHDRIITYNKFHDTIYLNPKNEILSEVSIYARKSIQSIYVGTNKSLKTQSYTSFKGSKILLFVPNSKVENKHIEKFYLEIKKLRLKGTYTVRAIFYENENGEPGKKLSYEKLIELDKSTNKKLYIDVSDGNLQLPSEGLFVGLEWLGCFGKESEENCQFAIRMADVSKSRKCLQLAYCNHPYLINSFFDINKGNKQGYCQVPVFGLMVQE